MVKFILIESPDEWKESRFSIVQSIYIYIYIYIYIQGMIYIRDDTRDESLLFCNCTCSLEYFSLSTLTGLSYHICGKLEVGFIGSPSS